MPRSEEVMNQASPSRSRLPLLPIAAFAAAGGLASLTLVGIVIWRGEPFAILDVLYVNPLRYLLLGIGGLASAYVLWTAARPHGPRAWGLAIVRSALLVGSLGAALLASEAYLRAYVRRLHQRVGGLSEIAQLRAVGKKLRVSGSHPLGAIIQPADDPRMAYDL